MKLAFIVHNQYFSPQVMALLNRAGIDYFTRWENAQGKGEGTEAHLGRGGFPSTNAVLMIGFRETETLERFIAEIETANQAIPRADDRIRLFQVPLERIV